MPQARTSHFDVVSKVTIHLFLIQVAVAMIVASLSPGGFPLSFALTLSFFAAVQTLLAIGATPCPTQRALTEWDGISWLVFLAMACVLF